MLRLRPSGFGIVIASVVIGGCGTSTPESKTANPGTSAVAYGSKPSGNTYHLTLHEVLDRSGTGKRAGTYLIPEGWTTHDTLTWYPNDYLTPVAGQSTVTSPDGLIKLASFSGISVNFGHAPAGNTGQAPPKSVSSLLLQSWKKDHPGVNFEVISKKDTPLDKSSFEGSGAPRTYARRGDFELRFKANGHALIAKCSARMDVGMTNEVPTAIGGTLYEGAWLLSNVWTVTSPADQLQSSLRLLGLVLASSRTDPHFFNTVVQCQKIIQQNFYAQQRQIMETSRIISQTNDQISDTIMSGYRAQDAAEDREVRNFDDYIRGVQRYDDGGSTVTLPSNYGEAWSNGSGSYIVSDSAGFDPNTSGASGSWRQLEPSHS